MKRKIVLLVSMLLLAMQIFSLQASAKKEEAGQEEEIRYIKGRKLTKEEIKEQKSHEPNNSGTVVSPKKLASRSVHLDQKAESKVEGIKTYDSRTKGLVTSVKNQKQSSWCWDYSLVSCMETSMIKNQVKVGTTVSTKENTDLSEAAIAYFFFHRTCTKDPLGLSTKDYNEIRPKDGKIVDSPGIPFMAAQFLSTGMGIKKESYYTLSDAIHNRPIDTKDAYKGNEAAIKNIYAIATNTHQIKAAVMDYGSVVVDVNIEDNWFNYDTAALYNPKPDATNHSVTIVGWDDTYSRKNFIKRPSHNGAWIVKNSWGRQWGDKGYFYLSYEDAVMSEPCTVEMQKADAYNTTYFYDGCSGDEYCEVTSSGKVAVEYTASSKKKGCERLEAISFDSKTANVDYSIQIYKDLLKNSNPESGTKALTKEITGTTTYEGVYQIPVKEEVLLKPGERYSIVITVSGRYDNVVGLGVEGDTSYDFVSYKATNAKNQSFYKWVSSDSWSDLVQGKNDQCIRIKAYTNNTNYKKVVFWWGDKVCSTQYIKPGESAKAPIIKRPGYQFVKWDKPFNAVKEDLEIHAIVTPNHYTVAYDANYGTGSMTPQKNIAYGATVTVKKNSFTRKGFTFVGWNTKKNGTGTWYTAKQQTKNLTSKDQGIVTLYAQWAKNITLTSVKSDRRAQMTVSYTKTDRYQSGYEIVYSTSPSFTKKTTKTYVVKGYQTTKMTISKLRRGAKYYVKVRPYRKTGKTKGYGAYTAVKKSTVKR